MYLPTRSASFFVLARTLLWTEKPEWRRPVAIIEDLEEQTAAFEEIIAHCS